MKIAYWAPKSLFSFYNQINEADISKTSVTVWCHVPYRRFTLNVLHIKTQLHINNTTFDIINTDQILLCALKFPDIIKLNFYDYPKGKTHDQSQAKSQYMSLGLKAS